MVLYAWTSSTVSLQFDLYMSTYCTVVDLLPLRPVNITVDLVVFEPLQADQKQRIENEARREERRDKEVTSNARRA